MPSISYPPINNPYAQPVRSSPISAEDALQQFLRTHHKSAPAIATVRSIVDSVLAQPSTIQWTPKLAADLSKLVLHLLQCHISCRQQHAEGVLATFFLLTVAMDEWDDDIMYAALIQDSGDSKKETNLMEVLFHLATSDDSNSAVSQLATMGLATAYRSLDRLEQQLTLDLCRPDVGWWLEICDEESLIKLMTSTASILTSSENTQSSSCNSGDYLPTLEQMQIAAASILCTILRRDQLLSMDVLDESILKNVCDYCQRKIQTLIDPQFPSDHSKWYLPCALASVSLVSLIQWRHDIDLSEFDRIVTTSALVENVTAFAFGTSQEYNEYPTIPQWIYDEANKNAGSYGLDLICDWALSGGDSWSVFLKCERIWLPSLENFWNEAANNRTQNMAGTLSKAAVLHRSSRLTSRGVLFAILQRARVNNFHSEKISTNLLAPLLALFQQPEFSIQMQALRLARALLSDRRNLSTHDDVSRAFWSWADDKTVQHLMNMVLRLIASPDAKQALFLATIDLLDTILQDQEHCDCLLKSMSAETLEQLIAIVEPKKAKFDFKDHDGGWGDLSLDITSETPPANNLSRMDENSICIEQEQEKIMKGLDATIQMSTATALARLGNTCSSSNDEGIHLLKARMCSAVNNFLAHTLSSAVNEKSRALSFDMCKRLFRLQLAVSAIDNEDFIATALFSRQVLRQKQVIKIQRDYESAQTRLRDALLRSNDLEEENAKLRQQNRSQSIIFKREMSRIRENTSQDAKQLVAIHATERSSAVNRASECIRRLEETESQLQNAIVKVNESQHNMVLTAEELEIALAKTRELESQNNYLSRQINLEESKTRELEEEMQSQTEKLDSLLRARQDLEVEIHERDQAIENYEAANENLRDNLEELFGDMVSLSTVYEAKEKEVVKLRRNHHDEVEESNQKLRREQEQNEELASTVDQLRQENDKLYKKVAKYKERLEDERRERQEEASRRKKNGPVSYINQLHQSTSSDRSIRDRSSTKASGFSNSRGRLEKENSYNYAAESQRRKKY